MSLLPTDSFSVRLRELTDNPGAVRAESTINRADVYGNAETWVITTFRLDGGEEVFLQRIDASATPIRIVLPPEVTAAMARQRDRATTANRKRGARAAVATRIARGDTLGNPTALLQARKARRNK